MAAQLLVGRGVKSERRSPHHANEANNKGVTLVMDYLPWELESL